MSDPLIPISSSFNSNTGSLDNSLYTNILSCEYFKEVMYSRYPYYREVQGHEAIVDEIYNSVEYLNPYIPKTRIPSSASVLLYKLLGMRMRESQIQWVITHRDWVYIRALGYMYLRFICDPSRLWFYLVQGLDDREELHIHPNQDPM